MTQCFEKFPVFPCEAPGLLRCFQDREVALGRPPREPRCGWLWAVSVSVPSIQASVDTAGGPQENFHIRASLSPLSVLLAEGSEDGSRNLIFPELLRKSMSCFTSC